VGEAVLLGSETCPSPTCPVCGKPIAPRATGRPARFCSAPCRQRAYRDRRAGRTPQPAADRAPDNQGREVAVEKAVPHLSEAQLLAWRGLLEVHTRLIPVLDDDLRRLAGLSISEFDVLYQLWIRPGARLRMKRLAAALLITPSGVTRIVTRLENDGLVRRESQPGEQAVDAELTEAGHARLTAAMDVHFAGVRRLFSGTLTDAETQALVSIWSKLRG
jgi:DNA-binding MarR family transcriptional regulator/predicted nucleic acid-binding Zn ribbon protein